MLQVILFYVLNYVARVPINLCALLHLSTAVGSRECPNRKAAAEKASRMFGLISGS